MQGTLAKIVASISTFTFSLFMSNRTRKILEFGVFLFRLIL